MGDPNDDGVRAVRDRFDHTQQVHLDLTAPPTREQVGIEPGSGTYIVERAGGDRFLDVELTLPGGDVLEVPAIGVVFTGEKDGLPSRIIIIAVDDDVAAARRSVETVVAPLGLDQSDVDLFFDNSAPDDVINSLLTGQPVGYLRLPDVEVFLEGPGETVAVNYSPTRGPAAPLAPEAGNPVGGRR